MSQRADNALVRDGQALTTGIGIMILVFILQSLGPDLAMAQESIGVPVPVEALGDVNEDGELNILDMLRIRDIAHGRGVPPTPEEISEADLNSDGSVDAQDVEHLGRILLRMAAPAFPSGTIWADACETPHPPTFTVYLPKLDCPPDEEGQGWERPDVWAHHPDAQPDSITIPNGRPIYALIVAGYQNNGYLDELLVYNFARHLMAQGAYVHYAWWNNLLAPYMERPLHHAQSHPGDLLGNFDSFRFVEDAALKAVPGEDYQFVADAELLLTAIRENNPSAMIVVVGHSMGGGAVVHLGSRTNVVLDILAPIDPVGNRNYPWSGSVGEGGLVRPDFNWTRWRVTRNNFLGYKALDGLPCEPYGPWLKDINEAHNSLGCQLLYSIHDAPALNFGGNVINLFHRYQQEALFPYDFYADYAFGHSLPPGGTSSQLPVYTHLGGSDPGGWPFSNPRYHHCCADGDGIHWPFDGHGEIVGYRGPIPPSPVPLAVRIRTSPQCGYCDNQNWPARMKSADGTWSNTGAAERADSLKALETLPLESPWQHRPTNPDLCMVSGELITLFENMNRPPVAVAGEDQAVECTGKTGTLVVLDGTASSDPDPDTLEFDWTWPGGNATGPVATVLLPLGQTCVTLTVRDPSGHVDKDIVTVTIEDTTPPELTVTLSPTTLWSPNHRLVDIQASVEAMDICGGVEEITLVSITSSDDDNGQGDGNTSDDIAGAEMGTLDLSFQLRAEWTGGTGSRVYTVTYQATDESANQRMVSAVVTVTNPNH